MEIRGIAPRILNLGTTCKWLVSITPRPLYPEQKSPRETQGGPQSWCERGGGERKSLLLPGIEPQSPSS